MVGPVANYIFLRYVGGDRANEASQEERYTAKDALKHAQLQTYRAEKNSFWPDVKEWNNTWLWTVVGIGAAASVAERGLREYLLR